MKSVQSWGLLSKDLHKVHDLRDLDQVPATLAMSKRGVAYGNGRSYGDVCLNAGGNLWHTSGLDKFISFDEVTGRLICESGVMLRDIQRLFVPRGWMLPVTPGTQLITVGGAIANDVHGKNHYTKGSFGNHIISLSLARTSGEVLELDWINTPQMLNATIGGLGLTGVVLTAELQLDRVSSPWIHTEIIPYKGLCEYFELVNSSLQNWEHTVSWIDCLSGAELRGIFTRGNHIKYLDGEENKNCQRNKLELMSRSRSKIFRIPLIPPISLVNNFTLRPFNFAYYHAKKNKRGFNIEHYESFFYPLDNLQNWNRMYGLRGFYQYQCVLPHENAQAALVEMMKIINDSGQGSFLAVLKTFGNIESRGILSFPMPGVTLALDFPNRGERTLRLLAQLDSVLLHAKGRLYIAKDARMPTELFKICYPRWVDLMSYRDEGVASSFLRRVINPSS